MGFSRLLLAAAFLASATSSPIAQDVSGDKLLPSNPGGETTSNTPATVTFDTSGHTTVAPRPLLPPSSQRQHPLHATERAGSVESLPRPGNSDRGLKEHDLASVANLDIQSTCTYTTSETVSSPCSWNGVMTRYPSTTTAFKQVDCNGCGHISIHRDIYYCPIQVVNMTEQAHTASTYWSTICSSSATPVASSLVGRSSPEHSHSIPTPPPLSTRPMESRPRTSSTRPTAPTTMATVTSLPRPEPSAARPQANDLRRSPIEARRNHARDSSGIACPTTFMIPPPMSAGVTLTVYRQTVTQTVSLPCLGCPLVTSTALMGYGPAGRFKTTVTMPTGYTTVYKCQ